MELFRTAAASTYIAFPMITTGGETKSGLTITGTWAAWADHAGQGLTAGNGFRTLSGAFPEIAATGVYGGFLATAELPAASPFVLLRFTGTGAATQYMLIRTASIFANVTGIAQQPIATPVTAGYMPMDVKQTIALTGMTDNSIEKSLARVYFATDYLVASVLSGSTYADDFLGRTVTRGTSGGRTVGQALMALRNRVAISAGTLTVYSTDDTTAEFTASIATQAVSAIVTDINPV